KISMYIEKSVDHELSGNIIDLCPVGALNNKPYRYSARAWEMMQRDAVSPHDCVGSNLHAHVLRGRVKRIVPRQNEEINETWISDRDRFSYQGIYSDDRLTKPRIKVDGRWENTDWESALQKLASALADSEGDRIGILSTPGATLEEAGLLAKIAAFKGCNNIDHRLRQRDFSDQDNDPVMPALGCTIAELETRDAVLVIGSNLRNEVPIIAHRVRKAALAGAKIAFINGERFDYHFPVEAYLQSGDLVAELAGVTVALAGKKALPAPVRDICKGVTPTGEQRAVADTLANADTGHIVLGQIAERHPAWAALRALAAALGELGGASTGRISEGPNAAGASLAGLLPHRRSGGKARDTVGLHAGEMLAADLDAVLLFGVEPDRDLADTDAVAKLSGQNFVAAMTPYDSSALREAADLLLPIGTFAESAGTYVNCEGRWQSFGGFASPVAEARPGWKVLRVLGNLLGIEGFDYETSQNIRDELRDELGEIAETGAQNRYGGKKALTVMNGAAPDNRAFDVPMYEIDAVVRRATALQLTPEARRGRGEGRQE
ncbi:MAG: molybdopterin-dependent oxidoreductase, partial [Woeseia sp.]